jgi:hypothetical protein
MNIELSIAKRTFKIEVEEEEKERKETDVSAFKIF